MTESNKATRVADVRRTCVHQERVVLADDHVADHKLGRDLIDLQVFRHATREHGVRAPRLAVVRARLPD